MRIANIISNLGIQNALRSAKLIVRNVADRPTATPLYALIGESSLCLREQVHGALWHGHALACGKKPRVTGGACFAMAKQRSGRQPQTAMRRPAAG